jgi:hypothetical protein
VYVDKQQLLLHAHCPHGGSLPEHLPSGAAGATIRYCATASAADC